MTDLNPGKGRHADPTDTERSGDAPSPPVEVPRTRMGAAWFAVCASVLILVVLIVFMMQNTGEVEVTFLGLHGELPLSFALLIAAVGGALVAAVVGVARLTQLRRRLRHR